MDKSLEEALAALKKSRLAEQQAIRRATDDVLELEHEIMTCLPYASPIFEVDPNLTLRWAAFGKRLRLLVSEFGGEPKPFLEHSSLVRLKVYPRLKDFLLFLADTKSPYEHLIESKENE